MRNPQTVSRYAIAITAALLSSGCDELPTIRYQHIANFNSWELQGKYTPGTTGMWHVFMLRDITHSENALNDFNFDITRVTLESGENVNWSPQPMLHAEPYVLPIDYRATIDPGETFTVPYGTGVLFFIKDDNATDETAHAELTYTDELVSLVPLAPNDEIMNGFLDQNFLNEIHRKQNEYEYRY
ncbi:hypothetical protein [Sorangium sp. So ce388]|uniref:hypothetical protein n=1 Tax=Sorangium sp. So ce388 TaxID=3133309 RepID=UPI003F5BBA7F